MKVLARLILIACLFIPVSACRAEEGLNNILYDVKSYQWWPIVAFLDSPNIPKENSFHQYAIARNAGYTSSDANRPARHIGKLPDDPMVIEFNVQWYEIVTKKLYAATIRIDKRQIKKDSIQKEFGIIILRIAGRGDLQAVTYEKSYPPSEKSPVPIVLDQVCATEISLSEFMQQDELKRKLADPDTTEGSKHHISIDDLPSRCN